MLENYQRSREGKCNRSEESCDKYKTKFIFCGARLTADQEENPDDYQYASDDRYGYVSHLSLRIPHGYFWVQMEEEDLCKDACQMMTQSDGNASSSNAPSTVNASIFFV